MLISSAVFRSALILSCLLCGRLEAQEAAGAAVLLRHESAAHPSLLAQERTPGLKSGRTALLWSLLGTAVPAAAASYDVYRTDSSDSHVPGIVLVGALLLGPSLGHFYASHPRRALTGIGMRALPAAAGVGAFFYFNGIDDSAGTHSHPELGQGLFAVGLALAGASLAWDIIRAPHSARSHNDEVLGRRQSPGITPEVGPAGFGLRVDVMVF